MSYLEDFLENSGDLPKDINRYLFGLNITF